ncbi:MAG: hypothetical protein JRN68_11005 [Nitrososphaerota archaeon]|jgi:hypothetical protein|nr:hypothetical protein [Nitrososphaerota archaeon]
MLEIPLEGDFRLPRVGSEGFRKLMSSGLEYDTKTGFRVKRNADLVELKMALRSQLNDEIEFKFRCFVCGETMSCTDCRYHVSCSIERCGRCICDSCMKRGLRAYQESWRKLLASTSD